MTNLNKRILTSIPLLILLVCAIYNNIILVFSLYIISAILIYEFSNILKNIFERNKNNLFIFFFQVNLRTNKMFFYLFYQFVYLLILVDIYLEKYLKVKN